MRSPFWPLVLVMALFGATHAIASSITTDVPSVEVLSDSLTAAHVGPIAPAPTPTSTTTTAPSSTTTTSTIPVNPACWNEGFAFAEENPEADALSTRIDAALEHRGFDGHDVSVSVWVDGWGEIATHNPDLRLHPASNQKVLTAIGANELLDLSAPLSTNIERSGNDLIIRAAADPTLTFPRLMAAIDAARPAIGPTIDRLIIDASEYPQDPAAIGWLPNDIPGYVGPLSGLMLDNNRWAGAGPLTRNPEQANGERIAFFLRERNITVDSVLVTRLVKPAPGKTVATVESAPIGSLVGTMLLASDNQNADLLLMEMGRLTSGVGSLAAGADAVESVLYDNCGSLDGLINDGSGLSRENWRSARSLVQSLAAIHGTPEGELLRSQLPVGGVSGTLAGRFGGANAGHVQAKTGTLHTARALSGWAKMADGRDAIFSVIVNGQAGGSVAGAIPAIDALVKEILVRPGPPLIVDEAPPVVAPERPLPNSADESKSPTPEQTPDPQPDLRILQAE